MSFSCARELRALFWSCIMRASAPAKQASGPARSCLEDVLGKNDPVVIIGAGLAGLSTAYHLRGRECVVLEKAEGPGGLAGSRRAGAFTFDYTGHLLHLRD